jgi:hypothetical protein
VFLRGQGLPIGRVDEPGVPAVEVAGELLVEHPDADQRRRLGPRPPALPPAQHWLPRFAPLSGRSAPELQAKSRHKHLATLGHYVRLGEETAARITAEHDTNNRRRNR